MSRCRIGVHCELQVLLGQANDRHVDADEQQHLHEHAIKCAMHYLPQTNRFWILDDGCLCVCLLQEEARHQAIVVNALYQAMNVLTPGKLFLGCKQVTKISEKRPRTLEDFMNMSLCGLSSNTRFAHGPAIMETLRQVCCTSDDPLIMQRLGMCLP